MENNLSKEQLKDIELSISMMDQVFKNNEGARELYRSELIKQYHIDIEDTDSKLKIQDSSPIPYDRYDLEKEKEELCKKYSHFDSNAFQKKLKNMIEVLPDDLDLFRMDKQPTKIDANDFKFEKFTENVIEGTKSNDNSFEILTNVINVEDTDNLHLITEWQFSGSKLSFEDYFVDKRWTEVHNSIVETSKESAKEFNNNLKKSLGIPEADNYTEISNEIESMEYRLDSCDGFEEEQISKLKDRIKEFETKLKEKVKPKTIKTITITNNVHNKIKKHCLIYSLKIGDWVEKTLMEKMAEMDPIMTGPEPTLEERKQLLADKYKPVPKFLIKSDKLLVFNNVPGSLKFKFVGHHMLDNKPVYEYIGDNYEKDIENIGCNLQTLGIGVIPTFSKYLPEFADFEIDMGKPTIDDELSKMSIEEITKLAKAFITSKK